MAKRNRTTNYALLGLLVFIMGIGSYWYIKRGRANPLDRYLTSRVERGAIRRIVSSTGTLQAVITVQVGSQVSGRIQELHADFNSVVKKGQTLAVIDPANFEAQRQRAEASLATAIAGVKNAEANLNNRKAELSSAKANLEVTQVGSRDAERQFRRDEGLLKDGLISERDMDNAQVNFDQGTARVHQAEAQVTQSQASVRSAMAQVDQASANVKQARAELQMAEVNLRYTNIISPIDGVVVERNVDIGQTVAASFQAPVLFLLANDLGKMQVIAQIDEADIGVMSEKAKVSFTVDAFPGQQFPGKISEVRLSSKLPASSGVSTTTGSASNVVVYNVMIDVDNPQLKLRPGMTANVNFTVASVEDVLHIANSALRYRPPDKKPEEIQRLLSAFSRAASADARRPSGEASSTPGGSQSAGSDAAGARNRGGIANARQRAGAISSGYPAGRGQPGGNWSRRPSSGGATAIVGPSQTDVYGIDAGMKIRFPSAEDPKPIWAVIWVLDDKGQPQPRRVKLGITDGRETAVLDGELKDAETVITGELNDDASSQQRSASSLRSPFSGPGGARRGGR